jgi:hypothetical protein
MTTQEPRETAGAHDCDPVGCDDEINLIGAGARAFIGETRKGNARSGAERSKEVARIAESTEPPLELILRSRPHHTRSTLAYVGASIAAGLTLGYLSAPSVHVENAPDGGARSETTSITQSLPWKTEIASETIEKQALAQLSDDIRALRAQIEQTRNATVSLRAPQRLRALEAALDANLETSRSNASAVARIDKLETRIGLLERTTIDRTPTGSTKIDRAAAPTAGDDKRADVRAAELAHKNAHAKLPIGGYVLRDVYRGVAFVESRDGVIEEVAQGDLLPGAGRVTAIARRGGDWVVVTTQGVINQHPY